MSPGRQARGICYRYVKGPWTFDTWFRDHTMMIIMVKESQDAMMLRLQFADHKYIPPYIPPQGSMDLTRLLPQIFWDGQWRLATVAEVEASYEQDKRELLDEIDETDDWVQWQHENKDYGKNR
jgi:hypothetical protein